MLGCLLGAGALLVPRAVLFVFWLTGSFKSADPWDTRIIPILGFFLMPSTTLVFGLCHVYGGGDFTPWWLAGMVVAVIYDLGSSGTVGTQHTGRRS